MEKSISSAEKVQSMVLAVKSLEIEVSEGLSGTTLPDAAARNIFGRNHLVRPDGGLAYAFGLAVSGVRSVAFLSGNELLQELQVLKQAVEHKVPLVVYLTDAAFDSLFAVLSQSGVFVFSAHSPQEAIDLGLIAHLVSESALVPGVVVLSEPMSMEKPALLSKEKLHTFLGNPDDGMAPTTPAQQLLFGKSRRRIPNWYNPDVSALLGARKSGKWQEDARSAGIRFFESHLQELINRAFDDFKGLSGRYYSGALAVGGGRSEKFLLADWERAASVRTAFDAQEDKKNSAYVALRQWVPFPTTELVALLGKGKPVVVMEGQSHGYSPLWQAVQTTLDAGSVVWAARGSVSPGKVQLAALIQNMSKGGAQKKSLVLGSSFSVLHSASPQHEVLLQSVARAYPGIETETIEEPVTRREPREVAAHRTTSWISRRHKDVGPVYGRLTHFFQHVLHFYNNGQTEEIKADPFQALPLIPAASAALVDFGSDRTQLPHFDPSSCTACGACLTACPHAALPSAALRMEQIMKGGMDMATKRGAPLSALTPLVKNLASLCSASIAAGSKAAIADLLEEALETLRMQMRIEGEKLDKVRREVHALGALLGDIPFAFSESLFIAAEQSAPGSGLAFVLATDASACTGCGLCAEVCPVEAMTMIPGSKDALSRESQVARDWEQLPDTELAAVAQISQAGAMSALAAPMVVRQSYAAMVGGVDKHHTIVHKQSLHQLSVLMSAQRQPLIQQHQKVVREVIDQLSGRIHQLLSDALPKREFSQIEHALAGASGEKVPLDSLLAQVGAETHLNKVDTQILQRQTQLVHELKDLEWLLKEGPGGTGSSFASMVLSLHEADWAGQFPLNHFTIPVILTAEQVTLGELIGLLQGQLRHWLDAMRLVRRGKLEAAGKYQPQTHNAALSALDWESLEPEERLWFPPLVVVLDASQFGGKGWSDLQELSFVSWPIKILVLDQVEYQSPTALRRRMTSLTGVARGHNLPVYRCTPALANQAAQGINAWLAAEGPALMHWFSPAMAGKSASEAALRALRTRAFTVAAAEGTGTSIDGNPAPEREWVDTAVPMPDGTMVYAYTFADWLVTLPAWEGHFRPWRAEEGNAMALSAYLQAAPVGRKGRVPVVAKETTSPEGFTYWIPDSVVLTMVEVAAAEWAEWQAMAGERKAGASASSEALETALKEKHAADLANLRREFDNQLAQEQTKWLGKVKDQIRDKLLALSTMKQ